MSVNVISKAYIKKLDFPVDRILSYNVQIVRSVDGGKNFWYCGCGTFCRTEEEARDFLSNQKEKFKEIIVEN